MSFAAPAFLLALLLIPAVMAAQAAARRRAQRHAVRFTGVSTLKLAALAERLAAVRRFGSTSSASIDREWSVTSVIEARSRGTATVR